MSKMVTTYELVHTYGYSATSVTWNTSKCPTVSEFETHFKKPSYSSAVPGYGGDRLFPYDAVTETQIGWMTLRFNGSGNQSAYNGSGVGISFQLGYDGAFNSIFNSGSMTIGYNESRDRGAEEPSTKLLYGRIRLNSSSTWSAVKGPVTVSEGCILVFVCALVSSTNLVFGSLAVA